MTRTRLQLLTIGLIVVSVPLALYVRVRSENSGARSKNSVVLTKESTGQVTVHAAGRGKPFLNLQDGRGVSVSYRGDQQTATALKNGSAQARALASADFDRNGTPDVIAGYALNGTGVITLQRGNPDAFAPADDSVLVRMQQGYNPDSLLPGVDVYSVPVAPDFLVTGNFTHDSEKDVLFAAKGGALYLMAGDGAGRLGDPQIIDLPGAVTALAAGEFRAADGFTDIAVGVSGPRGDSLLIFDDAAEGFSNALVQQSLSQPATGIEFGGLDDDPYMDVAVTAGSEILVVHGWGRKEHLETSDSRVERFNVGAGLRGLAVGEFAWDREGRSEIAALSDDGTIYVVGNSKLDARPFTEEEAAQRTRGKLKINRISQDIDLESVPSWRPGKAAGWSDVGKFTETSFAGGSLASSKPLLRTNLSYRETDDLVLISGSQPKLEIMRTLAPNDKSLGEISAATDVATLDTDSTPVAALTLPRKLNGVTDVVILNTSSSELNIVPNAPNTTITVDRTDDPSGAGLTAASACTAAANDCSLRGALQFANLPSNNNTTISLPANTYILSINGTGAGGCDGNTVGDLGANQTMSIVGAGAATTIIRQTGTGPANDGDRVMCMDEPFTLNLIYNFSGVTFVGGRDGTAAGTGTALGGGGIIGGEKGNVLTLTNVVFANNQVTVLGSANIGGGGIQWTGGDLNITNSTFGGSAAPGAYTDRTSTNTANLQAGSGGGVMFTPSAPAHTASTGILTVAGSTFTRNTAGSIGSGGGGADLLIFAFASPGGIGTGSATIGTSTFSNNSANPGNGGGILVESLATTVATTSLTNNSAGNRGGGIFVGGASLLLNGTTPSITFTGNTATNGGSSVSTSSAVTVDGTNTTIGGDIEVNTLGSWTNNAGSTLAPTNVVVTGGTFNMNNSTMNVSGNLTIGPGPVVGSTFNGNTGTVNIQGNFVLNAGGAPATTLNAGTGTFNFNGTSTQSISNGTNITFFNLTDSNTTQPLTLNNSLAVNGSLNVNGVNAILSPVAAAIISGTGTLTGTGTARVSRIAATPDFLSQYSITNKTLTNLTIDYNGAGNQTVNNTPAYSNLVISGSGTKTLQGNTTITGNLNIAAATLASGNFNFALGGNWTNSAIFTPGTGTVTFQGSTGTQLLTGTTTFFNLTLNNPGAITNFGSTNTTIGNDLVATAGTMDGGTSTIIFTGVTDNAGAISGANPKNFFNLQINSPATISNTSGGNITIENNYTNNGTFNQAPALTTIFDVDNSADGAHTLSGGGTTTFGNFTINGSNAVDAGTHNFNVAGTAFTSTGTFTGNAGTVTFNGLIPQAITGDGVKNFGGLLLNNVNGVSVLNGALPVDASVLGILTLNTDLTVAAGAILQQSGTSAGAADVLGTVRRTDLGGVARSFGNLNNTIQINSGTPPTQLDFNLVKVAPPTFPSTVKVVPRDYTLTPTGGSGISATLKLRYIDPTELTGPGITENRLGLWKNISGTWTPQGGTPDLVNNFVSLSGVSSFSEWAIAETSDLTLTKANNVSGSAVVGQAWNWTLTASNTGAPATFTAGQTILSDNLPNSNLNYGTPTVQNATNITGSANISCSIVSNDLTCVANGGSVTFDSNVGAASFDVVFSATPQAVGTYQNPRTGGGVAQIDPANVIVESNKANNSATANSVTVAKANTTTTISSDLPDPSVVGQAVTVQWSVTVNAPGSTGVALTGNVTVSDGTNQCSAVVSAGQCDVTFTSAGSKNLTATYAGDTNYNGSASSPATAHTVNKADTTTTITSDNPDPSTPGQAVIVQWTVTVNSPGSGTPTGNVTVSDGVDNCNAPVATGQCSITLTTGGPRTLTATYPGDTNFNTSSDTKDHQVCATSLVTSTADSGAGSLRQIIADACDNATITFDSAGVFATPQTITLTSGEILIDKNLTINAGSNQITVSGNNASRVFHVNSGKTAAIISLTISGGASANDGGAILNDGSLTIVNSTLSGNAAVNDGGAINSSATATSLTLINTTVSGNTAALNGGGLSVAGGTATIINSTITNNRADFDNNSTGTGGGIHVQAGTVTLKNTIVAGNFNEDGASDSADDISGTVDPTSSFNLVGTGGAGGLTNAVNNNLVGVASPGLGPLANNGGKTLTHVLLPTSPAINAGSAGNLPVDTFDLDVDANVAETLPVDQRGPGFPRQTGAAVDIGSVEVNYTITASAGTPQSTPVGTAFATGLAATVAESGILVSGISVTFTAPASGASGTFANSTTTVTVSTNGSGVATASQFTANNIAGSYNVTATATSVPGSALFSLTNNAGSATHFLVTAPASATAGSAFNFTVIAQDQFGNTVTGYAGTVHFTSSDGAAVLPANSTLTNGTGTFSATLKTAGNRTITATDTVTVSITGTSNTIAVSAGTATHYAVSAPASANAGSAFSFTVTAQDQFNNTATGYAGTVHFTSTDGAAVLPANSTLTNGVGTFSATLKTAGNQTITATDTVTAGITGTSGTIAVSAGAATHFAVTAPASAAAGSAFSFTVTALDQFNNTVTGYAGTVHFTSTDGAGVLPANSTLTNGTGTFSATLKTAGNQTITATDTLTTSITGTSNTIAVSALVATHFAVSAPANVALNVAFNFTVTAQDQFNNTATSYAGTVHFTSTDGAAVLPANSTLTNGVGTFSATMNTPGNQTITATDTVNASITGTSNTIVVGSLPITIHDAQVAEPATGSVNMTFTVTLSAPAGAGGVSVNFTTQNQAPALNHAVAGQDYTTTSGTLNFSLGEQVKTISVPILSDNNLSESNETFLVILSNPINGTIANGTATGTILITNQPGTVLISELRTSGPAGAGDDFVEIYNNSDSPLTVAASDVSPGYGLFKMGVNCSAAPVLIGIIPNGTIIPARGHYLLTGSQYSLVNYGGSGAAAGDLTLSADIESDANVGLFSTTNVTILSSLNSLDGVGFGTNTGGFCDLLREGTTLPAVAGSTLEYSFQRDQCGKGGNPAIFGGCNTQFPVDKNDNATDFIFADTQATNTPAGQHLGAPGPENLLASRLKNSSIPAFLLDTTAPAGGTPNRVRDFAPVTNGTNGTLSIRRRFVNNTGATVTRLRFRIVDISSFPVPAGIADVRALSSSLVVVNSINDPATCLASTGSASTPCSITVQGTTLEQPPTQPGGGSLNSSMSAGTITLATPMAAGASINVQFLLGVQVSGSFKFYLNIEALP